MLQGDGAVGGVPVRVLIADDHPLIRSGLRRLLEGRGHKVVAEAADGEAAVRLALAKRPELALLDVMMPGMSGLEAARQIVQGSPGTHVVMMSGYAQADCRAAAARVGAEAFIAKGERFETILATLDAVRRGRSRMDAGLAATDDTRRLTVREREVLRLVTDGYSSRRIAARLEISARTVDVHRKNLMMKLRVHSAVGLARFAIEHGLA